MMGLFEHWPYTNFHDLNLDWIIKKIKNVETAEANSAASAESAAASAAASQQSAEASQASAEASAESAQDSAESAAESLAEANQTRGTAARLESEMDLLNNRINTILAQGTPTEGNAELIDIRTGFNGTVYPTAGDAVRGSDMVLQQEIRDNLTETVTVPLSMFIHSCTIGTSGTNMDNDARAAAHSAFRFDFPVKIQVNEQLQFAYYDYNTNQFVSDWKYVDYFKSFDLKRLVIKPSDPEVTELTADMITNVTITTSAGNYQKVYDACYTHIKNTGLLPAYGTLGIVDMMLVSEGVYTGMIERRKAYCRASTRPLIMDYPTKIFVGRSSNSRLTVFKNGELLPVLHEGDILDLAAGDVIVIGVQNDSTSATNIQPRNIAAVVDREDDTPGNFSIRLTYSSTDRCDAACLVNDKVFMIARDPYNTYSVKQGSDFLVENMALDHNPGHANSCNYDPVTGKMYVSDWYNPVIHVYSVNYAENSLTYEKDITLPNMNRVAIEYHVFDNENQIVFMAWDTYLISMSYGLYVKEGNDYVLSYTKKAVAPTELQGFTYYKNSLYYLDDFRQPYKTKNINRIEIGTGATNYRKGTLVQDLLNTEGEDIFPIKDKVFMMVNSAGQTFLSAYYDA